jgi:carbonic anhydrase
VGVGQVERTVARIRWTLKEMSAQYSPRGTNLVSVQPTFETAGTEDIRVNMDAGDYVQAPAAPFGVDGKSVAKNYQDYAEETAQGSRKKNYLIFFLGLCCVVLLGVTIALAASGSNDDDASAPVGVADPKKYSYAEGGDVPGPLMWHKYFPECGAKSQSPIDIMTASDAEMSAGSSLGDRLYKHGECFDFEGVETENTWVVNGLDKCTGVAGDKATMEFELNGKNVTLGQFHLHAPSENTLNGKTFDAEIHFVYFDGAAPVGVIGVFLEAHNDSSHNAFLSHFWDHFDNAKHTTSAAINPYTDFFPHTSTGSVSSYYTWEGSLTTPPCSEGLTWTLLTQPAVMSTAQLRQYTGRFPYLPQTKDALFNNRPTQPLNGRVPKLMTNMGYSYAGEAGLHAPHLWHVNNPMCNPEVQVQSPIDVTTPSAEILATGSDMGELLTRVGNCKHFYGKVTDNTWKASGFEKCMDEDGSEAKLHFHVKNSTGDHVKLTMLQWHMHAPSENTMNGKLYDAEIHFVYVTDAGVPAGVIGVFLDARSEASDNEFLSHFWDNFDNHEHHLDAGMNPYDDFFPKTKSGAISSYYTWLGSLTTPPCWDATWSEALAEHGLGAGLNWHLLTQPAIISTNQLNKYKAAVAKLPQTAIALYNNRPVQPLDGRVPELHTSNTYSYAGEAGKPDVNQWNTAFTQCNTATRGQSPIDIQTEPEAVMMAGSNMAALLSTDGSCSHFYGKVTDNTWKVEGLNECTDDAGNAARLHFMLGDEKLTMLQWHMHAPSENTLNGKNFDAEVHFVYVTEAGVPAGVIGVFLEADSQASDNEFLAQFWDKFDNKEHHLSNAMNPYDDFFPKTKSGAISSYYTWLGSLTTPPCWDPDWSNSLAEDGLAWHLLTQPAKISMNQLHQYTSAVAKLPQTATALFNNRPTQPIDALTRKPVLQTNLGYSYAGENGKVAAHDWNDSPDFPMCNPANEGAPLQSPIDLPAQNAYMKTGSDMEDRHSKIGECSSYNGKVTDNTWKVDVSKSCEGTSALNFKMSDDRDVSLYQFHLHTPSENTMGGKHYDAEMHFVYYEGDKPAGVIGVFMEAKDDVSDNAFLAEFWDNFDNQDHTASMPIDPVKDFFPRTKDGKLTTYYTWDGSLTTPPCWDPAWGANLKWHLMTQPVYMSTTQLNKYKAAISHLPQTTLALFNNRPTQPLNGRVPQLHTDMTWSYTAYPVAGLEVKGPNEWPAVNADCAVGGTQSPIDIKSNLIATATSTDGTQNIADVTSEDGTQQGLQNFLVSGSCKTFMGKETENTWKVQGLADTCGKFTLPSTAPNRPGMVTDLAQFHLHAPSEHTIDGMHYDAEIHFVHTIGGNPAAVIGVMLQASHDAPDNAFLEQFWDKFDNKEHTLEVDINPYEDFLPKNAEGKMSNYYSYSGSLTTPPCSMTADWHLLKEPVMISYRQLDMYRSRLAHLPQTSDSLVNNRPVQPYSEAHGLRLVQSETLNLP